jgi:hypothetical protein
MRSTTLTVRLLGQMLLETSVLSFLGGIAGLTLSVGIIEIIKQLSPPEIYRIQEVQVDLTSMLFVGGVILLVAFVSGVLPAYNLSKLKLGSALKDGGGRTGTGGPEKYWAQTILVAGQVALACILLIGGCGFFFFALFVPFCGYSQSLLAPPLRGQCLLLRRRMHV